MKEKIEKLPKWTQEYIRQIERERNTAIRALNEYCNTQTPSPFVIEEMESTGERTGPSLKTRYVQKHKISVIHGSVRLNVTLIDDTAIDLGWEDEHRGLREVAFIPNSFQQARLVAKENMR